MRLKLFILMMVSAILTGAAQTASVAGTLVDSGTGNPVKGATVTIALQGKSATSDPAGRFVINGLIPGQAAISVFAYGYAEKIVETDIVDSSRNDLGTIALIPDNQLDSYYEDNADVLYDETALDDEEGTAQSITALTGASDNIYYNSANYSFSSMYFRFRGYDSMYQTTYLNGLDMSDPIRGRFSYSQLGGMTSRAFRNRTNTVGLAAASYGFGGIGGSTNISTITSEYAPGFNGSVAYTNANYMLRAMATYSTGISKNGWGLTLSAIGRYADEGVIEGTFYNSFGFFLSAEKVFNKANSLTLTLYGAPTQRATSSAALQEVFDLVGDNLYNPNWGWQDGKKRSAKIVESFDPTVMLNWVSKPNVNTTINNGAMFRSTNYSSSALNWYNANDPKPDYYRNLPSNFFDNGQPTELSDQIANIWHTDPSVRQLNWERMYMVNHNNNLFNQANPDNTKGSSYILENRHSNNIQAQIASNINTRLNNHITLQAGVSASYAKASYYKTIRDLLGGEYWLDIDPFSDREITIAPDMLQNDMDNPNRKVYKGDKFGYNYDINVVKATAWLQNVISLPQWDINYGLTMSYQQFQRDGKMRNGRAPHNSLGKGQTHSFDDASLKLGATYKIDGRNFISAHAQYGTQAPLVESIYISPRIKDTAIANPESERILTGDLGYIWNYRRFRGSITGYYTQFSNAIERTAFYDDNYSTFTNYVLSDVRRVDQGIELGMAYKITPSITASLAGTIARYQYKNNPKGTRSFENGMQADTTQTIYLKNYYVGGTPQTAVNIGIDWQAPKNWFFNINGSWMGDAYVKLSPTYHEMLTTLWQQYPTQEGLYDKVVALADQASMKDAFVLNASIGKLVYINRKVSMNFNLNLDNILNNTNIQNNAFQQGRLDIKDWTTTKYPNKYTYSQGFKVFLNVGIRF